MHFPELDACTLFSDIPIVIKSPSRPSTPPSSSSVSNTVSLDEDSITSTALHSLMQSEVRRFLHGDLKFLLETAKVGSGKEVPDHRGDLRCWVTPTICQQYNLPHISKFVKLILKYYRDLGAHLSKIQNQSSSFLDGNYSVQLAIYPGNGARYVRHLDSTFGSKSIRKLTAILYLHETCQGGQLRLYCPPESAMRTKLQREFLDVDAMSGRLVIFRSDLMEHEVLPTYSDRVALTIWAYGEHHIRASQEQLLSGNPSLLVKPVLDFSEISPVVHSELKEESVPIGTNLNCQDSNTIFVSIAAYRDSECLPTLLDLFTKATFPGNITVGVVWQGDDAEFPIHDTSGLITYMSQIRVIRLHHKDAAGPCYARYLAQSLWRQEKFTLQIDSHMRFRQDWDVYLIDTLEYCVTTKQSVKPILTNYPPGYSLPNVIPDDTRSTLLYPSHFDSDGILRQKASFFSDTNTQQASQLEVEVGGNTYTNNILVDEGERIVGVKAVPSPLWAAGFSFAFSNALHDVPYDPHLLHLFFGEEISMAARYYTHGYDFYTPCSSVVYHLWSRAHRTTSSTDTSLDVNYDQNREIFRAQSIGRVTSLLQMNERTNSSTTKEHYFNNRGNMLEIGGRYGLGTDRTLAQFEANIGVNFKERLISTSTSHCNREGVLGADELAGANTNAQVLGILAQNDNRSDNEARMLTVASLVKSFL